MADIQQQLKEHLVFLTRINPPRNWINRASLATASDYIRTSFQSNNYTVSDQKWEVGKFDYTNLIAKYNPHLKQRLIVGAHYDVFSNQPGADDNASGVAGLLVLAKRIAEEKPNLPYGIDFVSYCLEEPPHFGTKNMGSYIHAKSLADQEIAVIGMICLDMIGYFDDRPNSQQYPKAEFTAKLPRIGNFIGLVGLDKFNTFNKAIYDQMNRQKEIKTVPINFPTPDGLAGLSDHRNYWYFGFPAVMINDTAKFRNPNYHEPTDTVETLDLEKMSAVVNAIYLAVSIPLPFSQENISQEKKESVEKRNWFRRFFDRIQTFFRRKQS